MSKQLIQKEFKRIETKYLVPKNQLPQLLKDLNPYLQEDEIAQSTNTSLYFDTPDFQMIQDSLAKKYGKEKIRLRTYETGLDLDAPAFLEIKQKIDGIGYKYRIATTPRLVEDLVSGEGHENLLDWKMAEQLQDLHDRYGHIQPRMLISYRRQSFKGRKDRRVRVTIDKNVTYGIVNGLDLTSPSQKPLVPQNQVIMEIKVADTMPTWLAQTLAKYQLEKSSFSKYGQAYRHYHAEATAKEMNYA